MKVNSRMIFIMDMVDIYIPMEITMWVIGKMAGDKDGVNLLIDQENLIKECGKIINIKEIEKNLYFYSFFYLRIYTIVYYIRSFQDYYN